MSAEYIDDKGFWQRVYGDNLWEDVVLPLVVDSQLARVGNEALRNDNFTSEERREGYITSLRWLLKRKFEIPEEYLEDMFIAPGPIKEEQMHGHET